MMNDSKTEANVFYLPVPQEDAFEYTVLSESTILSTLIDMNIDACIFYREAASRALSPEIENKYHDLENMHCKAILLLNLALKEKAMTLASSSSALVEQYNKFRHTSPKIFSEPDLRLIAWIEHAEMSCLSLHEHIVKNSALSEDSMSHIIDATHELREYWRSIQELRRVSAGSAAYAEFEL